MAMKRTIGTHKTRLLLIAGALFITLMSPASYAQSETGELMNRLNQIETQMQTMSRAIYRGETPPDISSGNSSVSSSSLAAFEERFVQIEDKQKSLTGQLEKLIFDMEQVKSGLARLQADTDQRFQQMSSAPTTPVQQPATQSSTETEPLTIAPAPSSPEGRNDQQLGTLGTVGEGTAEILYEEAFANVKDSQYDQAENGFKLFLKQFPEHPLASNAQYWLGETYYVRGNYQQAAKVFAQGYQNFPKSTKAHDSLLKLSLALSKLGKKDDACLSLHQLQKEVADEANPLRQRAVKEAVQIGCQ